LAIDGLTFFIFSRNATINELGAFVGVEAGQDLGVCEGIGPASQVSALKAESVRWHFTSVPSPGLLLAEKGLNWWPKAKWSAGAAANAARNPKDHSVISSFTFACASAVDAPKVVRMCHLGDRRTGRMSTYFRKRIDDTTSLLGAKLPLAGERTLPATGLTLRFPEE
jgi:hypothetical protein